MANDEREEVLQRLADRVVSRYEFHDEDGNLISVEHPGWYPDKRIREKVEGWTILMQHPLDPDRSPLVLFEHEETGEHVWIEPGVPEFYRASGRGFEPYDVPVLWRAFAMALRIADGRVTPNGPKFAEYARTIPTATAPPAEPGRVPIAKEDFVVSRAIQFAPPARTETASATNEGDDQDPAF